MSDKETGESYLDNETGETIYPPAPEIIPEVIHKPKPPIKKRTFKIPKSEIEKSRRKRRQRRKFTTFAKQHKEQDAKDIGRIVLFFLPTVFGFPCVTLLCIVLEIVIHLWTHKKNKTLKNKDICYRSPLYMYMQQFYCFKCREELYNSKIEKIQACRMEYEYLKKSRHVFSM